MTVIIASRRRGSPTAQEPIKRQYCRRCGESVIEHQWRIRRVLCQRCWHALLVDLFGLFRAGFSPEEAHRAIKLPHRAVLRYWRMAQHGMVEGKFSPDTHRLLVRLISQVTHQAGTENDVTSERLFADESARLPVARSAARQRLLPGLLAGQRKAYQQFTLLNLRLIRWVICSRFTDTLQATSLEFLDLFQEGYLALRRAVRKYRYERGFRGFTSYAIVAMHRSITRFILCNSRPIVLPSYLGSTVDALAKWQRYEERAGQPNPLAGSSPRLRAVLAEPPPWEVVVADESSTDQLIGTDPGYAAVDTALTRRRLTPVVAAALEQTLTIREAEILRRRYGLGADRQCATLAEIGQLLGLTRERVRQIEKTALDKLRSCAHTPILREFYPII